MKLLLSAAALSVFACTAPAQDILTDDQSGPPTAPRMRERRGLGNTLLKGAPERRERQERRDLLKGAETPYTQAGAGGDATDRDAAAKRLRNRGYQRADRAFLGIEMESAGGQLHVKAVVPGSPAAEAGLKEGDILIQIDDAAIGGDPQRVVEKVRGKNPGVTVYLRWLRNDGGKSTNMDGVIMLEAMPGKLEQSVRELKVPLDGSAAEAAENELHEARERIERAKETDLRGGKLEFDPAEEPAPLLDRPEIHIDPNETNPNGGEEAQLDLPQPGPNAAARNEEAIWKRIKRRVAQAMDSTGIDPGVREKVTRAIEQAHHAGSEKDIRRTRLKAEAERLEKELHSLKERVSQLRQELRRTEE